LVETYIDGRHWPTENLTCGSAKISHAMMIAYQILGNEIYKDIGLENLEYLTESTFAGDYFNFSGAVEHQDSEVRNERPIDAGFLVEAYILAYEITVNARYKELARTAFDWFLGRNRLSVALYDFSTGACYDGLGPQGLNLNQGAESTLSFLLANLAVSEQEISRSLISSEIAHSLTIKGLTGVSSHEKI